MVSAGAGTSTGWASATGPERLEDVAQVDEQRAADGPEALGQVVDGELAREGVEVAARGLERVAVGAR